MGQTIPLISSWQNRQRKNSFTVSVWSCSPAGQLRAFARRRSRVLFSMCHQECVLGSCPSRSGGGTGSQFGKWTGSTTTSTPNWRVPSASEGKQNYGKNATFLSLKYLQLCVCVFHQSWPFVLPELCPSDWVILHQWSHEAYLMFVLEWFTLEICPQSTSRFTQSSSLSVTFVCLFSTFLSEQLSQDVAEMLLVVRREVEEDGSWLNSDSTKKWSFGIWHNFA